MTIAHLAKERSKCLRRSIGCILVNKRNHILATGYNGPPMKFPHCKTCAREKEKSGTKLGQCYAVHAEANALIQCPNPFEIAIAYVSTSPCLICTCLLLNTSCQVIMFDELYPDYERSKEAWNKAGRLWIPITNLVKNSHLIDLYTHK